MPEMGSSSVSVRTRPYFPELDGIRAIAAFMIMLFHFTPIWYFPRIMVFGQTGVDLFFVLSGFLITTILLQSRHGDWQEVRKFYIRRTLRIFPLYYGMLILLVIVGWKVSWWYWVYLQNIPDALHWHFVGPGHFWSLAVEEQFYLAWPFLVLFWPRRRLVSAMVFAIVLSIMVRVLLLWTHIDPFTLTLTRLDGLAGGGLLALLYQRGSLAKAQRWLAGMVVIAIVMLGTQSLASHGTGLTWVGITKFSSAALLYVGSIGLVITTKDSLVHGFLRSAPMRALGRVSYGMYVFHPAVYYYVTPYVHNFRPVLQAVVDLSVVYGLAWLSWYGYEKRFTDMKQRFAPERPFRAAAS